MNAELKLKAENPTEQRLLDYMVANASDVLAFVNRVFKSRRKAA
jgi:hypothetical protein